MFSKCLSLLVIGLLYAHQILAFPGNRYYVETQGPNGPESYGQGFGTGNYHGSGQGNGYGNGRGNGNGFGHGLGHHHHHHRDPNFNQPQYGPGPLPGHHHGPPPPPLPFGRPHLNPGQGQQFPGRQPEAFQPRPGYDHQPGQSGGNGGSFSPRPGNNRFGNDQSSGGESSNPFGSNNFQPRPGYGGTGGSFSPRPGNNRFGNDQSSGGDSSNPFGSNNFQPRPGQDQQPGQGGGTGGSFSPRPGNNRFGNDQSSGGESSNPFGSNNFQPRPGQDQQPGQTYPHEQSNGSGSFKPNQQRPSQSSENPFGNDFQSPRPTGGADGGQSTNTNTLQPRPVPGGNVFNFQTPSDDQPNKSIQPRPTNPQEFGASDTTVKPEYDFRSGHIPVGQTGTSATKDSTDDAINNIFNTESFVSPNLSQEPSVRDPKTQAETVPLGERGLFETEAKCSTGFVLMAGRCRKIA